LTFVVVYNYKIPVDKTKEYITLEKKAIKIYLECGCEEVQIFRDAKKPNKWMEINKFQDVTKYQEVISKINKDPRMDELFQKFREILYQGETEPEKKMYYRII
jgi:hypothetical protein